MKKAERNDGKLLHGERGKESYDAFLSYGREGYTSVFGDDNISGKIWKNKLKNVYICDCGCGFQAGRLGRLCLETKEEMYV